MPLDPEMAAAFKRVFDMHDEAVRALREARRYRRDAARSLEEIENAQEEAMDAAVAATRAAVELFQRVTKHGT